MDALVLCLSDSCVIRLSGPQCLCAAGFEGNGTFCQGNNHMAVLLTWIRVQMNGLKMFWWWWWRCSLCVQLKTFVWWTMVVAVCMQSVRGLDPAEETVSVTAVTLVMDLCVSVGSLFLFTVCVWININLIVKVVWCDWVLQEFCVYLAEINPCLEGNGGCHVDAECVHVGPNKVKTDFILWCGGFNINYGLLMVRYLLPSCLSLTDVILLNSSDFLRLQRRLLRWRTELQDD